MQGGIDIGQFWKNLQKAYKQSRGTSSAFTLDVCADAKQAIKQFKKDLSSCRCIFPRLLTVPRTPLGSVAAAPPRPPVQRSSCTVGDSDGTALRLLSLDLDQTITKSAHSIGTTSRSTQHSSPRSAYRLYAFICSCPYVPSLLQAASQACKNTPQQRCCTTLECRVIRRRRWFAYRSEVKIRVHPSGPTLEPYQLALTAPSA